MSNTTDTHGPDLRSDAERNNGATSPEGMENEVDQARARVGRTLSELSDRLSPGELIDQALGMAREHGGEFGRNLGAQVKNNPMPLILTSIGVTWMIMSSGGTTSFADHRGFNSDAEKHEGGFMDALGDTASKTRDKASAAGDRLHDASDSLRDSAQNTRESLAHFYRDQPLLAGSLGIAIGAALGALVPPTDIEDDMFGEARDRSVDSAKSKVESKYDDVRDSVRSE